MIRYCKICEKNNEFDIHTYPCSPENMEALKFENIFVCTNCQFGFAAPQKTQEELDVFYKTGEYWEQTVTENYVQKEHERNQSRLRVEKVSNYLPQKNINVLDIGAGHGYIAEWLSKNPNLKINNYSFIEPDNQNAEIISSKQYEFNVSRILNINHVNEQYDLIFVNHVLEHVADPTEFLNRTSLVLSDGGIAYYEVPNQDWMFKDNVFPHTLFLSEKSLRALAEKNKVKTLNCNAFGRSRKKINNKRTVTDILWSSLFKISIIFKMRVLTQYLDEIYWQYTSINGDGIWLSWMFRK